MKADVKITTIDGRRKVIVSYQTKEEENILELSVDKEEKVGNNVTLTCDVAKEYKKTKKKK